MSDEVVDYADLYKGLANYSWENTNIEVMRAQFERCQLFIKTILFNSHFGKQDITNGIQLGLLSSDKKLCHSFHTELHIL